jgi:Holliday junction resolvase RusA-like endonuclease
MKTTSAIKQESSVKTIATTNSCEKISSDGTKTSALTMKVTLPKPPSINHIYAYTCQKGFARSYITAEGRLWFQEAALLLKSQWRNRKTIEAPCEIWINLYTCRVQDVDNILKPMLDLLQKCLICTSSKACEHNKRVIKNDSLIYKLDIEKHKVAKGEERIEFQLMGY